MYTDFKDEVLGIREEPIIAAPRMTGAQYEKKVNDYLRNHAHRRVHACRRSKSASPPF